MLGRPNCPLPVFMKSLAGAWLKRLVAQDFTRAMSSTMPAVYGNKSLTLAPDCPYWRKVRLDPSKVDLFLKDESMKAKRLPSRKESGMG